MTGGERPAAPSRSLAMVTLVVPDYDEAIAFFVGTLGFELREDTPLAQPPGKRWVVVAPAGGGCALLLARATTAAQQACIGRQAGGRVGFFLHTDDMDRDLARWRADGVRVVREPRDEPYGRVAVFRDPWGNDWDLIEPPVPGHVRALTADDAEAAAAVVDAAIAAHIAPDWSARAVAALRQEVGAVRLRERIPAATLCLGSFEGDELAGVALMTAPDTLAMLFVHPAHERRGHGRTLWEAARDAIRARHPEVSEVRLNATPYARPVYERFGFDAVSAPFDVDGARAVRMACRLGPPGGTLDGSRPPAPPP